MPIRLTPINSSQGFTLIELILFIIIVGVATTGLFSAINSSTLNSVNPLYQIRALELAQAQMDTIFGKRYDEFSPVGGFPPCASGEVGASSCSIVLGTEEGANPDDFDDVDDYINASAPVPANYGGYAISIAVQYAGGDLGLANVAAKLITVTVTPSAGEPVVLSAYRGNF
jgi:MSHA pilin protein MshD